MIFDDFNLDKCADGLLPVIVQDDVTLRVLMLGYMNREAFERTQAEGRVTFYSRTRQALWTKGETSGNYLIVKDMYVDCDGDTLLLQVEQTGPACHTGEYTCFHNTLSELVEGEASSKGSAVLQEVYNVILGRMENPVEGSYTNYLLDKGVEKIAKKVGEEATETVIAAIKGDKDELRYEASDLLYHLLVLLAQQGVTPEEIWTELSSRR